MNRFDNRIRHCDNLGAERVDVLLLLLSSTQDTPVDPVKSHDNIDFGPCVIHTFFIEVDHVSSPDKSLL